MRRSVLGLCLVPWLVFSRGLAAQVTLTPSTGNLGPYPPNSGPYTLTLTATNESPDPQTYTVSVSCAGITCTIDPTWLDLLPWQSADLSVSYTVGAPSGGSLEVFVTSTVSSDQAYGFFNVSVVAGPTPIVDTMPFSPQAQVASRCAAACFTATYAQSTVPYFSLDAPRAVTLVYNGDRVAPKPFIHVNVRHGGDASNLPVAFRLHAQGGTTITFLNGETTLRFAPSTSWLRLSGQFDAAANGMGATGAYDVLVTVEAEYPAGLQGVTYLWRVIIVNENTSPVARGWTLAGIQRLYVRGDGSALITQGDGSAVFFQKVGSNFVTPAGDFSRLTTGMPGGGSGWTRAYPDSTKVVFNSAGRMIQGGGLDRITTVTYDGSNRVSQIKDPLNLALTLGYGANGLSSVTDPGGRATVVTVDASKRLTAIRDPDNVSTVFDYDGSLRLSTITDRRGFTTTLGYDAQSGKLATVTAPSVTLFDGSTAAPQSVLAAWQKVGVPYGSTGAPANAPLRDTVYARVTDPGGHVLRFTVNRWGSAVEATDALGRVTAVAYDANGLPVKGVYPSGGVDTAAYNGSGLPTYVKSAVSSATNIRYAAWARADSLWGDGQPGVRNFINNATGRIDSTRVAGGTPEAAVAHYTHGAFGRVEQITDPEGHLTGRFWYAGVNGNKSRDSLPGGRVTTYGYDTHGRVTTVSPPGLATTTAYYSVINRVDSVRDGVNPVATRYTYDNLLLTNVTDPKGQVYGFAYNALGWLTGRSDPAGHSDVYGYDRDGVLRKWTNRRGQAINYIVDPLHRVTDKSGVNTTTETWSYATNDQLLVTTSPMATDSFFIDAAGHLQMVRTNLAGQLFTRRYTYTPGGLTDSVIPSGAGLAWTAREYVYNATRGVLKEIRLGSLVTSDGVNKDGQPTSVTLPGGDQITRWYMPLHREAQISTTAPYSAAVNRYLTFDAGGRLSRHIFGTGDQGRHYHYDGLGRLQGDYYTSSSSSSCGGTPQIDDNGNVCTYSGGGWVDQMFPWPQVWYDSAGNRRDNGGTYDTGNRITGFAGCTYLTDNDGNVTSRSCTGETIVFTWSAESRLTGMTVNGQTIAFHYDAQGQLVRKDAGGTAQSYFLWDGGNLLAELNGTATAKIAEYSYHPGLDRLHALIVGGTQYFAHHDGIGNTIALTGSDQAVKRTYVYDAWGHVTGGTDYANLAGADRARFKGAVSVGPEVELYYMRARWYEPKTGRFLSEDPRGLRGGLNGYVYAGDDPVNGSDPTGLDGNCYTFRSETEITVGGKVYTETHYDTFCIAGSGGHAIFSGPGILIQDRDPFCAGDACFILKTPPDELSVGISTVNIRLKSGFEGCPDPVIGRQVGRVTLYVRYQTPFDTWGRVEELDARVHYGLRTETPGVSTEPADYSGAAAIYRQSGALIWGGPVGEFWNVQRPAP